MGRKCVCNVTAYSRSGPIDFLLLFTQCLSRGQLNWILPRSYTGRGNEHKILIHTVNFDRFDNVFPSSLLSVIPT